MLPSFFTEAGPMIWVLLAVGAAAIGVFVDRLVYFHRVQINAVEFIAGVRNVLRRDNVVEALAICDATAGPVARLVKLAILNREKSREILREMLEDAGAQEVPKLENRLPLLATITQVSPMIGLIGTVLGLMDTFKHLEKLGLQAHIGVLAPSISHALICTAAGLIIATVSYAGYNFLMDRLNKIVLDMEQASTDILNALTDSSFSRPQ